MYRGCTRVTRPPFYSVGTLLHARCCRPIQTVENDPGAERQLFTTSPTVEPPFGIYMLQTVEHMRPPFATPQLYFCDFAFASWDCLQQLPHILPLCKMKKELLLFRLQRYPQPMLQNAARAPHRRILGEIHRFSLLSSTAPTSSPSLLRPSPLATGGRCLRPPPRPRMPRLPEALLPPPSTDPILCWRYVQTYKYLVERDADALVMSNVFSGFYGLAGFTRGAVVAARVLTGQMNSTESTTTDDASTPAPHGSALLLQPRPPPSSSTSVAAPDLPGRRRRPRRSVGGSSRSPAQRGRGARRPPPSLARRRWAQLRGGGGRAEARGPLCLCELRAVMSSATPTASRHDSDWGPRWRWVAASIRSRGRDGDGDDGDLLGRRLPRRRPRFLQPRWCFPAPAGANNPGRCSRGCGKLLEAACALRLSLLLKRADMQMRICMIAGDGLMTWAACAVLQWWGTPVLTVGQGQACRILLAVGDEHHGYTLFVLELLLI
jgi:hypothetical protein